MNVLLILVGLVGLWLGTKGMITGALGVARRYKLSHAFVGVAILAVGTDLPEVFVTIKASLLQLTGTDSSGIITGNAIGSSISQISFILGVAGLFLTFRISKNDLRRDGAALFISIILMFVFGWDGMVSRWEGALLLLGYIIYYAVLLRSGNGETQETDEEIKWSMSRLLVFFSGGLVILIYASHLVVHHAMALATELNIAQSFIGIAIIGLGTSLPELAVSIGAAVRGSRGLSIGNIIGSNIFDGFIPIGLGGTISTVAVEPGVLRVDLPALMLLTLVAVLFLRSQRGLSRMEGLILIALYFGYIIVKYLSY